jgi:putative hydrolase of the HAD superfamily
MNLKAIIFDLDNTIYPVSSIADQLFPSLFQLLDESGEARKHLNEIKADVQRKPFQWVAAKFGLSDSLTQKALEILRGLTIEGPLVPFEDYAETRHLSVDRFLVTTGFTRLQYSKVQKMGLEKDFREIHVVDPDKTSETKKDVFIDIMERHAYRPEELLVVGDDPESEIRAAQELGIKALLYDRNNQHPQYDETDRITSFSALHAFVV